MRRPRRPPNEHLLGAGVWQRVLCLGAVVTVVALGAGRWADRVGPGAPGR
ncbi:hypothetical protein [Kitasatospora sp. NPDC051705]